jgi:hypothetical protein
MNRKFFLPLLLPVVLAFTQCLKVAVGPDGLTLPTQTGANTMSCKINGKIFIPRIHFGNKLNIKASYYSGLYFYMGGSDLRKDPLPSVSVHADSLIFLKEGEFELKSRNMENIYGEYSLFGLLGDKDYYSTDDMPGKLVISYFNPTDHIMSGRFEFTAVSGTDTVRITDGRFDIKF